MIKGVVAKRSQRSSTSPENKCRRRIEEREISPEEERGGSECESVTDEDDDDGEEDPATPCKKKGSTSVLTANKGPSRPKKGKNPENINDKNNNEDIEEEDESNVKSVPRKQKHSSKEVSTKRVFNKSRQEKSHQQEEDSDEDDVKFKNPLGKTAATPKGHRSAVNKSKRPEKEDACSEEGTDEDQNDETVEKERKENVGSAFNKKRAFSKVTTPRSLLGRPRKDKSQEEEVNGTDENRQEEKKERSTLKPRAVQALRKSTDDTKVVLTGKTGGLKSTRAGSSARQNESFITASKKVENDDSRNAKRVKVVHNERTVDEEMGQAIEMALTETDETDLFNEFERLKKAVERFGVLLVSKRLEIVEAIVSSNAIKGSNILAGSGQEEEKDTSMREDEEDDEDHAKDSSSNGQEKEDCSSLRHDLKPKLMRHLSEDVDGEVNKAQNLRKENEIVEKLSRERPSSPSTIDTLDS